MLRNNLYNILTREKVIGFRDRRIDMDTIISIVKNFSQPFYVCGPEQFVDDIQTILVNLGANPDTVVIEK
jgi:ferredoxin-NADP reductase